MSGDDGVEREGKEGKEARRAERTELVLVLLDLSLEPRLAAHGPQLFQTPRSHTNKDVPPARKVERGC